MFHKIVLIIVMEWCSPHVNLAEGYEHIKIVFLPLISNPILINVAPHSSLSGIHVVYKRSGDCSTLLIIQPIEFLLHLFCSDRVWKTNFLLRSNISIFFSYPWSQSFAMLVCLCHLIFN